MYNKYIDREILLMDATSIEALSMTVTDIELRMIDPQRNRLRLYGITESKTLFGEHCLRIVWGRIGHRRLRERTEVFSTRAALERRRLELLSRRVRHGYVEYPEVRPPARDVEREIVEAHGLPLASLKVRAMVSEWHTATKALADYIAARKRKRFDLVDVSTLAAMYAAAEGFA